MTDFLPDLADPATRAQYKRDLVLIKEGKKHPLKTGKCDSGWHEGKKPKDRNGVPIQVCGAWQVCPCSCHEQVTMLFKMSDLPRDVLLNPEYRPVPRTFQMPRFGIDYGPGSSGYRARTDDGTEVSVVARKPEEFTTTPSGRMQAGGLESMVHAVFQAWLAKPATPFLPTFVSAAVAGMYDVKPPSTGAIGAVFDRWAEVGFATQAKKPVRLEGITDAGKEKGLEMLKIEFKRKAKFNG